LGLFISVVILANVGFSSEIMVLDMEFTKNEEDLP
jgi:hypothetical protein